MRGHTKFVGALVLCMCVLFQSFSLPIIVHAQEKEESQPWMTYISSYSCELTIAEGGVAHVSGVVRGKSGVTSAYVKCTLQMSIGGGWVDVISWQDSRNERDATVAQTYQLSSRGTYRVYMECRANTEEKTATSAYRTY